jgi:hypothetical protein
MEKSDTILSPADHEHFLSQGYVVVKGAVPSQVIARAVMALEAEESDPDFDPAAACITDAVHQALAELFGPEIPFAVKGSGQDLARPYTHDAAWSMLPAHVDDAYPTSMPNDWAIGTFIFLTQVQSRGGAFVYYPGSPLRYRQGMAQSCHAIKQIAAAPQYSGLGEEFLAEPGDVLLFQHLMGHTGSDNVTDAQTRHALLNRWISQKRIVPGGKPLARMSTIEKANSARYLEHRFKVDLGVCNTPGDKASAAVLSKGWDWGGLGRIRSYALLHFNGQAQVLAVSEADPAHLRRWQSDDLIHWHEVESPNLANDAVQALYVHQYGFAAILAVTYKNGSAQLYSSLDFTRWQPVAQLEGCRTVTPWYVYANYPSKIAAEQALFHVRQDDPARVICRWGPDWPDAAGGSNQSIAAHARGRIEDLVVAARHSDRQCALVADVVYGTHKPTRLHYSMPQDVAVAEGTMKPLACEGIDSPCRMRIFSRGPSFWLVTFLGGEQDRLFWGYIDWEKPQPTLQPLTDAAGLDQAKSIVGMI